MMKIDVKELKPKKAVLKIEETDLYFVNSLRRVMLSELPKLAVDNVVIYDNTSALFDEIISHRLGLIPIPTDLDLLSFRDEYPVLVDEELRDDARRIAVNCLLIDEFIAQEIEAGKITQDQFTDKEELIKLHGHCHQKALASTKATNEILSFPANYSVEEIPSGCCGMAGSFGYEIEHYDLSMKVGELVLLPAVRKAGEHTLIAAPGTSCRHQIKDGTGRVAYHPIEILYNAVK